MAKTGSGWAAGGTILNGGSGSGVGVGRGGRDAGCGSEVAGEVAGRFASAVTGRAARETATSIWDARRMFAMNAARLLALDISEVTAPVSLRVAFPVMANLLYRLD